MNLKVSLSVAVIVLFASGANLSEAPKLHPAGGLLFVDPYSVPGFKTLDKCPRFHGAATTALLSAVDMTAEMPPVGDQGAQNSCVAWATGYYDKTHAEYLDRYGDPTWDLGSPEHQISPSFIYNQINAGRDAGAIMMDAQILLCDQGSCMLSDFPYHDNDYVSWPSEAAYENAITYRGYDSYGVSVTSDVGINQVKAVLANHTTCVVGINVYTNFDNIEQYDTVYTVRTKTGRSRGGHALCIVGYDDNKQTADGPGAFRLVNSWGTEWGNAGYCWMSYEAVRNTKAGLSQNWVYVTFDRLNYSPSALGRVKLSHPCRDRISITFGAGSPSNPLAYYTFRRFWALQGTITDRPFPSNNLVFDLSGGATYFDDTDTAFVTCLDNKKDRKTGSIDFFSVEYGARRGSSGLKVMIPDYNIPAYDVVAFPRNFGPQGSSADGPVATNRVSYRSGAATVAFSLPQPGVVKIAFYDNMGRTVARAAAPGQSGSNAMSVRLPSTAGVYFYRLESGSTVLTGKLTTTR